MNYYEYIEDFLEHRLTEEENRRFETELGRNSLLKTAVNNYHDAKKISEGLLELDMMDTLNKLQQEGNTEYKEEENTSNRKWMGVAVLLLLLFITGWWINNRESSKLDKSIILATYERPIDSDATKSLDTIGMNAFEKGKYYFALNRFVESKKWLQKYISEEKDENLLSEGNYWLGAAHIELWEVDEAKEAWKKSDEEEAIVNLDLINK